MCGLVALFVYSNDSALVDSQELKNIRDSMVVRGPDGDGIWVSTNKKVGFGHRRLSILDLSDNGTQPMKIESLSKNANYYHITYNGEIYNFRELRNELEQTGVRFHTESDTEVILRLYERDGPNMLEKLRGMFAIVIWDEYREELFLARDPHGIKPLYYNDNGKVFRAASQVKSLLVSKNLDTAPSPEGHVGFFLFGSVPEPYTLYKNICALPAGHWMRVQQNGKTHLKCYYDISSKLLNASETPIKNYDFRDALMESIKYHFVSDVPIGMFLSGGLDSASLVGLANEIEHTKLNTITLGFSEFMGTERDEVPLAEMVAQKYKTQHHTEYINRHDFDESYQDIIKNMDQPTIDGVNTYFVSRAAKKKGLKAVITGLGGDEIFGGYNTFSQLPKLVDTVSKIPANDILGKMVRILLAPLLGKGVSKKWAGIVEYGGSIGGAYLLRRGLFMPWELNEVIDPEIAQEGLQNLMPVNMLDRSCLHIKDPLRKVAALETLFYLRNQLLRDSDWAGMAHSIEIRLPLVDRVLFEVLAPILLRSNGPSKLDFAMAPSNPLPTDLLKRKKVGFFVPIQKWTSCNARVEKSDLRSWAKTVYQHANMSSKY